MNLLFIDPDTSPPRAEWCAAPSPTYTHDPVRDVWGWRFKVAHSAPLAFYRGRLWTVRDLGDGSCHLAPRGPP